MPLLLTPLQMEPVYCSCLNQSGKECFDIQNPPVPLNALQDCVDATGNIAYHLQTRIVDLAVANWNSWVQVNGGMEVGAGTTAPWVNENVPCFAPISTR